MKKYLYKLISTLNNYIKFLLAGPIPILLSVKFLEKLWNSLKNINFIYSIYSIIYGFLRKNLDIRFLGFIEFLFIIQYIRYSVRFINYIKKRWRNDSNKNVRKRSTKSDDFHHRGYIYIKNPLLVRNIINISKKEREELSKKFSEEAKNIRKLLISCNDDFNKAELNKKYLAVLSELNDIVIKIEREKLKRKNL